MGFLDFFYVVAVVCAATLVCTPIVFGLERIIYALYDRVPAVRRFFDDIDFEEGEDKA